MNRKESKEQNDTSIIIGHLPKRLQMKFAESSSEISENGLRKPNDVSTTGISHFTPENEGLDDVALKNNTTSSSKQIEDRDNDRCYLKQKNNSDIKNVCTLLPGVLRIHQDKFGERVSERRKQHLVDKRKKSPISQNENIKDVIPISPARVPIKHLSQPIWLQCLGDIQVAKDLPQLYESLISMIRRNAVLLEWDYFCETHNGLKEIFIVLVLQHLKFVCEQKVDTFFWKVLYYNIREYLKTVSMPESSEIILSLINDGIAFYQRLHELLSKKYSNTNNNGSKELTRKFEFIAKVADQKILICLGDLSRYKAKQVQDFDYSEAFKFYQEAQRLIPTNAIPYNQLAIVSLHARKQFDAVYFHMRSLMSSNPIVSAKESLLVLFDEIRKKYEETKVKTNTKSGLVREKKRKNNSIRKEVWIHPDGARLLHRMDDDEIDDSDRETLASEEQFFKNMSIEELIKSFTSIYLYMIGKLFSGIGMETIHVYEKKLFIQLNILLMGSPISIKRNRLMKIAALNIFLIEHNLLKTTRREIRYRAFYFANQCFGIVVKGFNEMFNMESLMFDNQTNKALFYDLNTLLQYIRVYVKWLRQNTHIWEPIRRQDAICVDCWKELELFFSKAKSLIEKLNEQNSSEKVVFEEDNFFLGFTPLSIIYNKHETLQKPSDDVTQFIGRLRQILEFEKVYNENLSCIKVLNGADTTSAFVEEFSSNGSFEKISDMESTTSDEENDKKNNDNLQKSCVEDITNFSDDQVIELARLKKELEAKTHIKKNYNKKLQEILNFVDNNLLIEVRPKYLMPDTNCFIDHLSGFELLVKEFKCFNLIVPLTVVKELEGLAKGVKLEEHNRLIQKHRIHHYDDVSTCARKSLDFIKAFKNSVRCATTKGSIINASLYGLVEEEYVSNDDKILATALALMKNTSQEVRKGGKCFIRTELVLITTDRNLRVKALSRNLAVSELNEFLQWAQKSGK